MHYKNGKEAKIGDQVVGRDSCGNVVAGVLMEILSCTDTCNGRVVPQVEILNAPIVTLGDCVNVDDIAALNPPVTEDSPY